MVLGAPHGAFRQRGNRILLKWHHSSLAVSDLDEAIRFFAEAFGFELDFRDDGMAAQIESIAGEPGLVCDLAQLRRSDDPHVLELIAFRPSAGPPAALDKPFAPGAGHVAVVVDDLGAAMAKVEALGAHRLGAVTHFEEGPAVYYRTPGGSFLEIEEEIQR